MKYLPKPSTLFLIYYRAKIILLSNIHNKWVLFWSIYAVISLVFVPKVYVFGSSLLKKEVKDVVVKKTAEPEKTKSSLGSLIATREAPIASSLSPFALEIPKIGLKTEIEQVGQTKTHEMDVPKNAANVAWYVYGAKPGEVGNAVISGHFDTPSGKPAAFFNLRKLVVGDKIIVTSEDGKISSFSVQEKKLFPYKDFPSEFVFHTKPGKNLNLITCAGIWDKSDKIYNQRLVIYAGLDE